MELQAESSAVSKLQRMKADLRQWEQEFQKRTGRVPSKPDVQACPSIHSLYREYARLKLKFRDEEKNGKTRQADEKENAHTGLPGHGSGISSQTISPFFQPEHSLSSSSKQIAELTGTKVESIIHLPKSRGLLFPATSSNSEDSDDGSHVSATPPKRTGLRLQPECSPISSYRPLRRPLQEMSAAQLNERICAPTSLQAIPTKASNVRQAVNMCKRKAPESGAPKKLTSTPAVTLSERNLSNAENTLHLPELPQEPGFVIKRRRPGIQFEEQNLYRDLDVLPAGFSATVLGSSLTRKDCNKSSVLVNESIISEVDSRTPGESGTANSGTANSCILRPCLGEKEFNGGTVETHPGINNSSYIGSSATSASPKLQCGRSSATEWVSSNLQLEFELTGHSNPPANSEVEAKVTGRDVGIDLSGKTLHKLTVVVLKQMLLKRGLPVVGNKGTLISRLNGALGAEAPGDCPLAEKVGGENCEQTEKVAAELPLENESEKEATSGTQEVECAYDTGKGDDEPSSDPINSDSGKLVSSSSALATRSRTKSRRCAVRTEGILSSSSEKITHFNSDLPGVGNVEVAGSILTSKRVRRKCSQEIELPVIQQDASCEDTITSCTRTPSANDSCPGKLDPLNSQSVDSAGDANEPFAPKMSNKRVKLQKQPEELSWSKPKALQRHCRAQNTTGTSSRSSSLGKVHNQTLKPGVRNNFVKLNMRGRGGGRRKFVNKTHFRKPGAYGRRGYRGRKALKPKLDEADEAVEHDLLHADEVDGDGGFQRKGAKSKRSKSTSAKMDTWFEADPAHCSVPDCTEDSKSNMPAGLSEALLRVLDDPSTDNLLEVLELAFGFKGFRAGQLEAVKRILTLQSTMVMLPTGAGKSLCYQLPALVLPGVTLVISPLIALMTDQLRHLPPSLPGAVMSSSQTYQESSSIVARLRAGLIKVLFISPERLCSESFQRVLIEIPKISLAVIDEAHCLSEWSHNFRPSYFRLGSVLLEQMKVPCILAMTATATKRAERSIMGALRIPPTGLVQASHVRENVVTTVSKQVNRLRALLRMLQDAPYSEARSIIIYCTFQVEADNISDFLQQSGIQAKSYHAKKTSQERSRILDHFCSNKLRVVVATVAFGMGLDKSDVGAVIHYNMPRSLEHYVQETGRAGRDGKPAFCHLFLDDRDYLKLRSLAHSEGVDEYSVGKVLNRIFHGKQEVPKPSSIIIEAATKEFDMKEEVLETILSYLEVGDVEYVKSVWKLNVTCALSFHRSSPASLAERSSLAAAILRRSQEKQGRYVFDMVSMATELQLSMCDMQFELRRLQVAGEISCEYGDPGFSFTVSRFPEDVCLLTSAMTKRLNEVETSKVAKVDAMYTAALAAVCRKDEEAMEESSSSFSSQQASFQEVIKQYFDEDEGSRPAQQVPSIIEPSRNFLRADIKDFVRSNKHARFTGRAVARIFYGIWSPAFPYSDWSKNHSWGKYEGVDFGVIKDIATAELVLQHSATRVLRNS